MVAVPVSPTFSQRAVERCPSSLALPWVSLAHSCRREEAAGRQGGEAREGSLAESTVSRDSRRGESWAWGRGVNTSHTSSFFIDKIDLAFPQNEDDNFFTHANYPQRLHGQF